MAVEDILKNAKKRTKKVRKHIHGVNATDERYTGAEPVWDDWKSWPKEKFEKERSRAFNFYNYYLSAKETKPKVLEWMEVNGYSKQDISAVRRAPDYLPGITVGTLCTSMLRGMPSRHPEMDYHPDDIFVRDIIVKVIAEAKNIADPEKVAKEPAVSPMVFLKDKTTRTIIMDLDVMLDQWSMDNSQSTPIDIYARMQEHKLPAASCNQVEQWLTRHRDEMGCALDKSDPYLVEVYQYLTKEQLTSRVKAFNSMLADLDKFRNAAKATRAPREKKPVSATKQISSLKYCKENAEFKIASVNPVRIVGAYRLLAFNTKYRILLDYVAQNEKGLSIKGTTLQNVDDLSTRAIRLRKPDEFLPIVLNNTPKQIEKAWSNLTTKESKPKPRINGEVVLLRVFETRTP
jgi:hypothetical protein